MAGLFPIQPIYSHGGATTNNFIAVPGTSTNSGRPISIIQATLNPAIQIFWAGTSVTVLIEGNGGQIDSTGNPPSGEWLDYSSGGFALTNGQSLSKYLPRTIPYWRTRITAINTPTGVGLVSYCPSIIGPEGKIVSASYPPIDSGIRTS
jgi:hypothetical protein